MASLAAALMGTDARHRGWREHVETGIYREHRLACPSTRDRRPGRRCDCPYTIAATGAKGRTVQRTVVGTLAHARRERARLRADAGTIRAATNRGSEVLHSFAAAYLRAKSATLRPATISAYDRAYRTRIAPYLGAYRLDELTRERLEGWLADLLRRDPHRRSIEHAVQTLAAMLATAVEWNRIPINPAARLRLPPKAPGARAAERVLSPAQLERLYAHAGSLRTETMFRAAAEAGLRRGEIIGLRWRDVLLDQRRLIVRENIWQTRSGERLVQTPKSGHGRRVAITATLAEQLRALRSETVADTSDYVWPGKDGRPMAKDSPGNLLERVQRRAGLVNDGKPLVSIHGLRHTAASVGLAQGVPLIAVSQQLGHARVDITAQVYAHLLDDSQLDAFASAHERKVSGALSGERRPRHRKRSTKPNLGDEDA
jgi:integrase